MVFAPQLKLQLEEFFWNGQGENKGLAYLIKNRAPHSEIKATRSQLDLSLGEAETEIGKNTALAAIAMNAGIIVFREGLEAVVILASLMSSLKSAEERKYRRPMWLGVMAVISLGTRPTFGGGERVFEVHLLDRDVDLYGQRLRVELVRHLRGQRRYTSADALVAQMARDVGRARRVLATVGRR